jgi:hypothetical protein
MFLPSCKLFVDDWCLAMTRQYLTIIAVSGLLKLKSPLTLAD